MISHGGSPKPSGTQNVTNFSFGGIGVSSYAEKDERMKYRPVGKGQGKSGERKRRYEPQPIGDVLTELAARYGLGQSLALEQLQEAWKEAVGPDIAPFTKAVGVKGGLLEVVVAASVWVQELNFQKAELLAEFKQRMPKSKIRGLRFKVGPLE